MYTDYDWVALFLVAGLIFVVFALFLAYLVRPSRPNLSKLATYECGEPPVGQAWIRFNVRYYIIALIFLLFDVDLVFIYPWAVAYRLLLRGEAGIPFEPLGFAAFGEMAFFLFFLIVGWIYAWKKGALEWV